MKHIRYNAVVMATDQVIYQIIKTLDEMNLTYVHAQVKTLWLIKYLFICLCVCLFMYLAWRIQDAWTDQT